MHERILVIDDDDALRAVLSAELEGEGYQVDSAPNLKEGLAKLTKPQFPFDLAIVEPFTKGTREGGIDAHDFLESFRESRPCHRLLVLTMFADLGNAIDSKKCGADDFLSKPYDLLDLLSTVERILSDN